MGNFNRDGDSRGGQRGGFGGRRSFGDNRGFGGRGGFNRDDRGDRPMFNVVCSNCGKDSQVPFRPSGDKPVYCSECFEKMGGRDNNRRSFDRPRQSDRSPSDDKYKAQLESVNAKLDRILNILQPKNAVISSPAETVVEAPVEEIKVKPAKSKKLPKEKAPEVTE
jgi:CxxC-x17-CxxC domain-containing protein